MIQGLEESDAQVLIWSHEHGAWWRPGGWGYASIVIDAGLFTEADAAKRIQFTGVGEHKGSVIVPLSDVEQAARSIIQPRRST